MTHVVRHITEHGRDLLAHFPVTVIQGARQVGKSTLAQLLASQHESVVVSLDDDEALAAADADPVGFVSQAGDGLLVVDEVQRRPELLRTIKASVDRDRRPGRFLLTGSANLLRVKGETDSLAGRAVSLRLRGFSQGEMRGQRDDLIGAIRLGRDIAGFTTEWRRGDYAAAMARGGFPEVGVLPDRLRRVWLEGYAERVLQRDATELPGASQFERLRVVARLLAANQAGELVKGRVAEQAAIPAASFQPYLDALESIYMVEVLRPWTPNLTQREIGRAKAFIEDSALAMRLGGTSEAELSALTSRPFGGLLEALVASELLKQQGWTEEPFQLYHYRERTGPEVDLVVELESGGVIVLEVRASSTYKSDQFRSLEFLRERLGDRFVGGFVLGTAAHGFRHSDRLWGLPIAALWEM
ncbi:MAG: AAA family ATPase [bacterium]|nr:AAA family ATPase [bacterium]